jgi:uncharacterized tellurite resistance protein B-like protein
MGLFGSRKPTTKPSPGDPLTVAKIFVDAAMSDKRFSMLEKELIDRALAVEFGLDQEAAARLREEAEAPQRERPRIDARDIAGDRKIAILETLWRGVLANRDEDHWETELAKRVAKRIGAGGRELGLARRRVMREIKKK